MHESICISNHRLSCLIRLMIVKVNSFICFPVWTKGKSPGYVFAGQTRCQTLPCHKEACSRTRVLDAGAVASPATLWLETESERERNGKPYDRALQAHLASPCPAAAPSRGNNNAGRRCNTRPPCCGAGWLASASGGRKERWTSEEREGGRDGK